MEEKKLWTKNFILVSVINFLLSLVLFLLIVTIASYAVNEFGASISMAGLISGIFIIGILLGRLIAGRYIQTIGSKKTLFIGLIFFILTTGMYFVSLNIPILLLNRILHGFTLGIASTATGTIIAQIIPDSRRGEGIGYFSLSTILSTAIGPFVGILLMQIFNNYMYIFLFNFVLAVCCFLFAFFIGTLVDPSVPKSRSNEKGFKFSNYIESKAVPISLVALVVGFSYSGIMSFISFYSKEINLVKAGSSFFLIYALVILLSRPFTGRIMDSKGANIIIYPCLVLYGIGMLLYSQANYSFMVLLAGALVGIGYGNFNSIAQTIAIESTVKHRLGLATSTYFIFFDIGLGIGPYVIGYFVPIAGYRGIYLGMVLVILISIALYHFLLGKKKLKHHSKHFSEVN
jgi:MFS family permease